MSARSEMVNVTDYILYVKKFNMGCSKASLYYLPNAGRHVYNIKCSIDHVTRAICYGSILLSNEDTTRQQSRDLRRSVL